MQRTCGRFHSGGVRFEFGPGPRSCLSSSKNMPGKKALPSDGRNVVSGHRGESGIKRRCFSEGREHAFVTKQNMRSHEHRNVSFQG
jgi:hypothetical protein